MRWRPLVISVGVLVSIGGIAIGAWPPRGPASPRALPGWPLYERYCVACHGAAGDGRGPGAPYTKGRPRDLVNGDYAWRSTPIGQPPTDDDLRATLRHGAPGTSMPGFALSPAQLDDLVAVVKAFAPARFATPAVPIGFASPPAPAAERGAKLWSELGCASCHGARGAGDTAAAKAMASPPYDLTRELHRPRATDDSEARRRAAALSIATGLAGTAMPGYAGTVADADIWALADHVVTLRGADSKVDRSTLDAAAIARDRVAKLEVGRWPGTDPDEARLFGGPIAPQGAPPASLGPAQASLAARQCSRCHNKQFREWEPSLHHGATSPGLAAQMYGLPADEVASCLRCHAPLPEQATDRALYADGASCAGCHVRNWTRHGPEQLAPSLLPLPGYPLTTLAVYERADFCLPCHQLPPRTAVAGKPLLNTYKEWLEGPYMKRGVQCQHCHMPNREHSFKGIHDPQTFREGIALTARAHARDGTVTVTVEVANVGAGHYLPTTPTPAAWLSIELLDARGKPIRGGLAKQRIGRDIYFDGSWHERADTRIPPGEKLTMTRAWRVAGATTARVKLDVHPDDYYERLYASQLRKRLVPERRALYEEALARGRKAHYTAEQRELPITAR
ncbi:MAG: c-type cytochrome [Deltaproteobacteria bacterium]|nr:c-type cytochrome [Deltaproteobacteria bacterium]